MHRDLRKYPRVPTNLACSLRGAEKSAPVHATTLTVSTEGLGLCLKQADAAACEVGADVTVSIPLGAELTDLDGRIIWIGTGNNDTSILGVQLASTPELAPAPYYQTWVEQRFETLRQESMALGGDLAGQREITLRALQQALDDQARDGGNLTEHLQRLANR